MKITKQYRFEDNPAEKKLAEAFIEKYGNGGYANIGLVVLDGDMKEGQPYLTEREENIVLNTIQWLGSPVGRSFMKKCGFEYNGN